MATSNITNNPSIVESGTSGIWTYRKWSDGTAECWGKSTNSAGAAQRNYRINYPTGLFISEPVLSACGNCDGAVNSGVRYVNTTAIFCDVWITSESAAASKLYVYAIGKWK